jgi:hypothetical protein
MGRQFLACAMFAAASLLAGCDGGGGGSGDAAPRIEGLLTGVSTRSSTERDVVAFASDGRFMAAEAPTSGFFFDAEYALGSDGTLSGTARIYGTSLGLAHARYFTQTGTLSGTAGEDAWTVTITGASSTTTFELIHEAADIDDSSVAAVEGTWVYDPAGSNTSTLTIDGDGTTASTNDSGCASAGTIAPVDPDFNLYDSATTVTNAPGMNCADSVEGSYTGLISLFDPANTGADQLIVMLAKSDFMFRYAYDRQP